MPTGGYFLIVKGEIFGQCRAHACLGLGYFFNQQRTRDIHIREIEAGLKAVIQKLSQSRLFFIGEKGAYKHRPIIYA